MNRQEAITHAREPPTAVASTPGAYLSFPHCADSLDLDCSLDVPLTMYAMPCNCLYHRIFEAGPMESWKARVALGKGQIPAEEMMLDILRLLSVNGRGRSPQNMKFLV